MTIRRAGSFGKEKQTGGALHAYDVCGRSGNSRKGNLGYLKNRRGRSRSVMVGFLAIPVNATLGEDRPAARGS